MRLLRDRWHRIERATRPVDPDTEAALRRRWDELPEHVKHPGQLLGQRTTGCEGTHGVFPRCNLACTPCYHSREANRVRVDGAHTLAEVDRQMAYLRAVRGPNQHAQLIGGEVTLLSPEDHAQALLTMRSHRRKPMSMSHGDFDYEYLERLAVDERGRRRVKTLAFAGHFDSLMFGRRGIKRPRSERDLNPHRQRFVEMFERLRREHGVRYDLAHNMTVTPRNLDQVADVVRDCLDMGFGMFSFQPAAHIGNPNRWRDRYRDLSDDAVWAQIEQGVGARLPFRALQMGDERCNRSAYGVLVGRRWIPIFDDRDEADCHAAQAFLQTFGGMDFDVASPLLAVKLIRVIARRRDELPTATRWALRFLGRVRRAGLIPLLRHGARPLTFVMHSFMDASQVRPAWEALQRGETADDPAIRATQERLRACSYAMAHPDDDMLVPACVQHSVLDPQENLQLTRLLPLRPDASPAASQSAV